MIDKSIKRTFVLISLILFSALFPGFLSEGAWEVKSYRKLRFKHVAPQEDLASCGPASLASLFTKFFDLQLNERKIIEVIKKDLKNKLNSKKSKDKSEVLKEGISMLQLKKASIKCGIPARGYTVPKDNLHSILENIDLPLLIHLHKPEKHFLLAVSNFNDQLIIADPSWGLGLIPNYVFGQRWDGAILAFSPDEQNINTGRTVSDKIINHFKRKQNMKRLASDLLWR